MRAAPPASLPHPVCTPVSCRPLIITPFFILSYISCCICSNYGGESNYEGKTAAWFFFHANEMKDYSLQRIGRPSSDRIQNCSLFRGVKSPSWEVITIFSPPRSLHPGFMSPPKNTSFMILSPHTLHAVLAISMLQLSSESLCSEYIQGKTKTPARLDSRGHWSVCEFSLLGRRYTLRLWHL